MSIRVALHHRTSYTYDRLVTLSPQIVRLRPAPHCRTPIHSYSLRITPEKYFINWQQDPQGNYLARLVFPEKVAKFSVEVDVVAEMLTINPFDFFLEPYADAFPFRYEEWLDRELRPYKAQLPLTPKFETYLKSIDTATQRTVDFLVGINQRLWRDIKYLIRMEPGVQTPEETLRKESGSCRDSAWLLVQILRHLGFAARFVSGYLIQLTADVKSLDGPSGPERDFTDLHAWCEVYLPGAGWVGLDPTSGLYTAEGHIPLAATPDPSSAAPITGAVDECECEFAVDMHVRRIHEDPRVTKPYTPEQWDEIMRLGHRVDEVLRASDVRLSMGGEPTFVSIDDMDGEEWNTAAVGPMKRGLAGTLIRRLRHKFAPGAFLHFGQGKWYPGEQLPRWALGCYWRRDGVPCWTQEELIADDNRNYGHGIDEAERFMQVLAQLLEIHPRHIIPAYEDPFHYSLRERRLPVNVDPLKSNLDDPQERARLARIFEQGLGKTVGFVLPIQRTFGAGTDITWGSGAWFFRTEHMFLIPGDSPIGFRLPLDGLPWGTAPAVSAQEPLDPLAPRPDLPRPQQRLAALHARLQRAGIPGAGAAPADQELPEGVDPAALGGVGGSGGAGSRFALPLPKDRRRPAPLPEALFQAPATTWNTLYPAPQQSADWIVRTALCVEPRDGHIKVFMPPTRTLEEYLDLVAAIEETSAALDIPVQMEGYTPPQDVRLSNLKVTPDPGVIEVNIHPSLTWEELVERTTTLYEEARLTRLGTEKFMLDGRHTGTGGGNHVVIGGPTPADSPFLRRPDLLKSLLGYWINHPSLSYLLSGLFIGPTSQHPRVDESRHEALYELEIAFRQLREHDVVQPWLVDRLFRHILTDATGNTHRAEFCIDKLYSPDSSSGRLGLVEFRGFEMPPHAQMSLTQQLLLRAMIAWFWNESYEKPLVRWGTQLHDRFMLPHFVRQDFEDVIEDLRHAGHPLRPEWFDAHFEFRFPIIGSIAPRGIQLELRNAIEPWNVLGEEGAAGATVRFVDSSVERVQVKVQGMTDSRHAVLCNGRRVPLHPTGTKGEFVAGIRFRAWQPPSCLHPTIPVHSPLVLDLVDTWNGRSVGGCTYHVAHPGGRNFVQFPVNALEAESRRASRFWPFGHTPGLMPEAQPEPNADFPFTLDLRRQP